MQGGERSTELFDMSVGVKATTHSVPKHNSVAYEIIYLIPANSGGQELQAPVDIWVEYYLSSEVRHFASDIGGVVKATLRLGRSVIYVLLGACSSGIRRSGGDGLSREKGGFPQTTD